MSDHSVHPRVPVEHRLLGLDRRTLPLAAVALAVYLLWAWLLPWIDGQVGWDDPVQAGERLQISETVALTPPVGWDVVGGLRTTETTSGGEVAAEQTAVTNGSVTIQAVQGPFEGTPKQLLDDINLISRAATGSDGFKVTSGTLTFRTASGLTGVGETFDSAGISGLAIAFVVDGIGIKLQVVGAPAQMSQYSGQIDAMLASITATPGGSGS